jgi:hypothetical protein
LNKISISSRQKPRKPSYNESYIRPNLDEGAAIMDSTIMALLIGGAFLVVVALGVLIYFWMSLPGFWAVLKTASQDKDLVDPDAEIFPLQERHSSDVLKDRALEAKSDILPPGHVIPQQAIAPQAMPQQVMPQAVLPPMVEPVPLPMNTVPQVAPPPVMPNAYVPAVEQAPMIPNNPVPPVTAPAPMMPNSNLPPVPAPTSSDLVQTEIYQAPQELVQRPAILDSNTPIVDTPPAPIQGEVPQSLSSVGTDDGSKYAVRDSSLPPGRRIRDGRYNRNASG